MKLFNQLFNNKLNFFDNSSLLLFSILPISIIAGNASININIFLIDLIFLIYCFKFNEWRWLKRDIFLYLMALYVFLNLNSLYSYFILFENQTTPFWLNGDLIFYNKDIVLKFYENDGIKRSFLFIKFVLLVFAFSTLLRDNKILSLVHKIWFFIITVTIFDVFFEKFIGRNIVGNISLDGTRIVSFFKDEMVVGGFIFCFGYASTTYFINNNNKTKSTLAVMLIFLLVPLSIFITGEKSNFIKSILLFFIIIYYFYHYKHNINYKILLASVFFLISFFIIFSKDTRIKYSETYDRVKAAEGSKNVLQNIRYFAHYDVALKIFKNYPITGIGNKNFRIECYKKKYFDAERKLPHIGCITHPHQVHFEILSEQGILGYILVLFIIIWFSVKNFKIALKNKNVYHLSNTAYLLIFFIPLLPGGGIFSTFNGILFWMIFSLVNLNYEKK